MSGGWVPLGWSKTRDNERNEREVRCGVVWGGVGWGGVVRCGVVWGGVGG